MLCLPWGLGVPMGAASDEYGALHAGAVSLQSRQCDCLRCCGAVWLRTVLPNGACSGCCTPLTRVSTLLAYALVGLASGRLSPADLREQLFVASLLTENIAPSMYSPIQ